MAIDIYTHNIGLDNWFHMDLFFLEWNKVLEH
jgi:hypothetical protein